jgi:uridine kinase
VDGRVRRLDLLTKELLAAPGDVRLVGIDGLGAAGKTTLAQRLAKSAADAPVVHTDDFASFDGPMHWWPRMLADVVEPLLAGRPASYHPYDWVARRFADDTITVEPAPLILIEGVGATRAAWRDRLTSRLWVDAPRELRLRRGLERDGEHLREFWDWWMKEEDAYVRDEDPFGHADLVVDGASTTSYDADTEFVELVGLSAPR